MNKSKVYTLDFLSRFKRTSGKPVQYIVTDKGCFEVISHAVNNGGYPHKRGKPMHRLIWEYYNEEIPYKMCVLHKCDNRLCINIEHLSLGTYLDNELDMINKGRNVPTCGERNGQAKLTKMDIDNIKVLRGQITQSDIAKMYGISQSHVCGIQIGLYWKHLEGRT